MEVIGWIALGLVGLVGFIFAALAVSEYVAIQFTMFLNKVNKEVEVRKEHLAAKAELKKERLARKREVQAKIANTKLDIKLDKMKANANEKFGEKVFVDDKKKTTVTEDNEEN